MARSKKFTIGTAATPKKTPIKKSQSTSSLLEIANPTLTPVVHPSPLAFSGKGKESMTSSGVKSPRNENCC